MSTINEKNLKRLDGTRIKQGTPVVKLGSYHFPLLNLKNIDTMIPRAFWYQKNFNNVDTATIDPYTPCIKIAPNMVIPLPLVGGRRPANSLWGAGKNDNGQLGISAEYAYPTEHVVTPFEFVVHDHGYRQWLQVACGSNHTAAIANGDHLYTTGSNAHGQLGRTTTEDYLDEFGVVVIALEYMRWEQVACGSNHTVAIRKDGTLWACGDNHCGQLGRKDYYGRDVNGFVQVGYTKWKQVACGGSHTMAIDTEGYLWGCGDNTYDQLGLNYRYTASGFPLEDVNQRYRPLGSADTAREYISEDGQYIIREDTPSGYWYFQIVRSNDPSVVLYWIGELDESGNGCPPLEEATLYGKWYDDINSIYLTGATIELTDSSSPDESEPLEASTSVKHVKEFAKVNDKKWKQVACGSLYTMAIDSDGYLWGCGANLDGCLGFESASGFVRKFTQVNGKKWKKVACGGSHTVAIAEDGTVWGCGNNQFEQLHAVANTGDDYDEENRQPRLEFVYLGLIEPCIDVACGSYHTVAIGVDGTMAVLGYNYYGQLGAGDYEHPESKYLQTLPDKAKWKQVACGSNHTMAIRLD